MFRYPKDVNVTKTDLEKIKISKNVDKSYNCDYCNDGPWPTEIDLEIHRKSNHKWRILKLMNDENSHVCTLCLQQKEDRKSLVEHIKVDHLCCGPNSTHLNRPTYICDYCQRLFFNKQLLITHIQHQHTNGKPPPSITCPKCWRNVRYSATWYHFLTHGICGITACPICLEDFDHTSDMREHVKTHSCSFICDICGYETSKEIYHRNHVEKNHKKGAVKVTGSAYKFFMPNSDVCATWRHRYTSLLKGIPLTHIVKICVLCRRLCESEQEMKNHIYSEHAPQEQETVKRHICMCGDEFFNKILLKQHIFKLKGSHQVWDGVSPLPQPKHKVEDEETVVYRIYDFGNSANEMNEIIVGGCEIPIEIPIEIEASDAQNSANEVYVNVFEPMDEEEVVGS